MIAIRRLGARDRRALVLGAVLLLPAVAWALVLRPYIGALGAARDRLEEERGLLARERTVLAAAADYPLRRRRAGSALGATWTRIVRGVDTLSVAASLTSYVSETAEETGLYVEQVEARGADSLRAAALERVRLTAASVELRARGDLEGVLDFLAALETGETIVRVDRLRIEPSASAPDAGDQETLALSVTVTGIARVLARPASAPVRPTSLARRTRQAPRGAGDAAAAAPVEGVRLP